MLNFSSFHNLLPKSVGSWGPILWSILQVYIGDQESEALAWQPCRYPRGRHRPGCFQRGSVPSGLQEVSAGSILIGLCLYGVQSYCSVTYQTSRYRMMMRVGFQVENLSLC